MAIRTTRALALAFLMAVAASAQTPAAWTGPDLKRVPQRGDIMFAIEEVCLPHLTRMQTVEEIAKACDRDYYMTSEEAKAFGIVDDILLKQPVTEEEEFYPPDHHMHSSNRAAASAPHEPDAAPPSDPGPQAELDLTSPPDGGQQAR